MIPARRLCRPGAGEVERLRVITDNGGAFKSDAFRRFINGQPHLEHIRTRHYAPETNGLAEHFNRSLGVRASLPRRDRQRGRAHRGGRSLPGVLQRGQAVSVAGAEATARRAARWSTPVLRL